MLKYKILMWLPVITIMSVITLNVTKVFGWQGNDMLNQLVYMMNVVLLLANLYSLIHVLKNHCEKYWLRFPFYLLLTCTLLILNWDLHITTNHQRFIVHIITLLWLMCYFTLAISFFSVKNNVIRSQFQFIGASLIFAIVVFCVALFEYTLVNSFYGRYIREYLILLPLISIFYLHYKLYSIYELFKTGNSIITKIDLDNVPQGTIGIILQNHQNSDYYEVEFLDDKGNLINTLSVSSDDFEHTPSPDLETRVENFGQA